MLKKTVTYTDYNGLKRTEDFYFNLSKAEITELQVGTVGGYAEMVEAIIKANDEATLIKIFKELVLKAYGKKSPDGRLFMKVDENGRPSSIEFSQLEAYSEIFMELATDADAAAKFVNGIIPSDVDRSAIEAKQKELLANNN